jgi:hypothetical protein
MRALKEFEQVSKPTRFGTDRDNLALVQLPIAPSALLEMQADIDAKALYRGAIDDYLNNTDTYDRFAKSKNAADADRLPGLKKLLDATHAKSARIFADDPGEIVTYKERPELDALVTLGHLSARAALLEGADKPEDARSYFEAEFALGSKLYDERLTLDEFDDGLELLAESGAGLTRLFQKTGQSAREKQFHEFDQARMQYYNSRVLPMVKVLQSIDTNVIGEHAGDIIYFASSCGERMYRVEAIFAMGRMKYFAGADGRIGNQRGAMTQLRRLAEDPDPIIRRAATEARDLTIEQYRALK